MSTCFYYDTHSFHADADDRFHEVDSRLWEFGVTTRLHETVEIGGGLGRFSFSSRFPDSDGGEELSGGRFAVTFPRFVFKPLLAIPWGSPKKDPAWGFLQLYFKHTIIVGTLADEDFASLDGTDFIRTNQRVESVGVTFDLTGSQTSSWIEIISDNSREPSFKESSLRLLIRKSQGPLVCGPGFFVSSQSSQQLPAR